MQFSAVNKESSVLIMHVGEHCITIQESGKLIKHVKQHCIKEQKLVHIHELQSQPHQNA